VFGVSLYAASTEKREWLNSLTVPCKSVVIIGPGIEGLKPDDDLQILVVGREIPGLGVPLVVPKARLRVQSVAGAYVVARTATYDVEVAATVNPAAPVQSRMETRRYELKVDETQLAGNPSNTPVAAGDPVIRPSDLPRFMRALTQR
jgi:hypothetical protein